MAMATVMAAMARRRATEKGQGGIDGFTADARVRRSSSFSLSRLCWRGGLVEGVYLAGNTMPLQARQQPQRANKRAHGAWRRIKEHQGASAVALTGGASDRLGTKPAKLCISGALHASHGTG
jgi:hypothetical protein